MSYWRRARTALLAFGFAGCCFAGATGEARAEVAVPRLTARVVDQTGTLLPQEKAALEQTLAGFEARKGSQIALLLVPTTGPETIEEFSLRVADAWKIGRQGVDDGAILVVAKGDRKLRIEVGYGLEGALNDATSKRIISEIIVPRFQQGDFHGGLAAGVARMIAVVDGEALPPAEQRAEATGDLETYVPVILVGALAVGGLLRVVLGRFLGALITGGAVGLLVWWVVGVVFIAVFAAVIALLYTLFASGRGARHGGFGGGWSGGGGFSGGGGGFGGGGASGRW